LADGGELSVRLPSLTGKEKTSGEAGSSEVAKGDRVAHMLGRLNLTSQETTAFTLDDEEDEHLDCPKWALVSKVLASNPLHITTIREVCVGVRFK
jgi:hypothetical protein